MFKKLRFWLAVATVLYYGLRHYVPTVPFSEEIFAAALAAAVAWILGEPLEEGIRAVRGLLKR